MILKFIKIFFSILALMLFVFLIDVTFYFSSFSKNTDIINSIIVKKDLKTYYIKDNKLKSINNFKSATWTFVKNINFVDKVFFSNTGSFDVNYSSWYYNIDLKKWLFLLDLSDLSSKYKIKSLGFEMIPKSAGMIFIDNTDDSKVFIFSLNSIYKFIFKSYNWRKVNYYYMYPHNYLLFNINNNKFSRLGWDVFRIKTIVKDWFFDKKLEDNLDLWWVLKWDKLRFFKDVFYFIKNKSNSYKEKFNQLKNLESFHLIWEQYIGKYFKYFINDSKKKVYYKQSILNDLQLLFKQAKLSTDTTKNIITKLKNLKSYDPKSYYEVLDVIDWYYKIIVKNNSLNDKNTLDNFLPLIKYLKLLELNQIKSTDDLSSKIKKNQIQIFNKKFKDKLKLLESNLDYLYILRGVDIQDFNKIVLNLQLKYKNFKKDNYDKYSLFLIDKYYYWVLNLKQWNDDLELYILLKNIFFAYDFSNNIQLEKYFNEFVNNYFSKLKIVDWKIILGQHLDLVLLESFLYYLEDYLNTFAFNIDNNNSLLNLNIVKMNINILDKYMFLNNLIYFNNGSDELIKTWLFKNRDLLDKLLSYIRKSFFEKDRTNNNLLVTSSKNKLDIVYINKLKNILAKFFTLENKYKNKLLNSDKEKVLLDSYNILYKKFREYFLALTSYEDYKAKYDKSNQELNDYTINNTEKTLWVSDIKKYLSQFDWSYFTNTKIEATWDKWVFFVKDFNVSWKVFSFLINPERDYTITDTIIEDDPINKDKFKDFSFSLARDKEVWNRSEKYAQGEDKKYFNFKNYFKYKFFPHKKVILSSTTDVNTVKNDNESESVMIFKRDKLLAKQWEFANINDILKIKYNNVIVKDLSNISIKDAQVLYNYENKTYLWEFSSKYLINLKENKHYFYNDWWIFLSLYDLWDWSVKRSLLWWNKIKINFNISLNDFRNIFNNIFSEIWNLDNIYYKINSNFWIYNVSIEYKKDAKFVIWFEFNKKIIKIYLSWSKVLFIKNNWQIIDEKNISLDQNLDKILLKLK